MTARSIAAILWIVILPALLPQWLIAAETEAGRAAHAEVRVVRAPAGCFVPDVVLDAKGVLHMVYALDRNAYYVKSTDNGRVFSKPTRVNVEGTVEYRMGERGPKLAVDREGTIHVVWGDFWAPGVNVYARYSRSRDGGKTFERPKTVSSMSGIDGLTLAAGGGQALVFWHVMHPPQNRIPQATWLRMARSDDNGATFAPDEPVRIENHSGLACSMCMMRARMKDDGKCCLAFRSAEDNIRDFYVLEGPARQNRFSAIRVNEDHWQLKKCPMCGPELTFAPDGRLVCAFMSRHKVYWSMSDAAAARFHLHVATPAHENDEIFPTAVTNRRGEVLFVWQVGPMSTTGTATVHWACYTAGGKFTGRQGTLGTTTSGTKATAFVGNHDNFYIVTTAADRAR